MGVVGSLVNRKYTNFRGIDLLNPKSEVDITRSPDCLNVWKDYDNNQGNMIQTRPGFKQIAKLGNNKINSFFIHDNHISLVHIGNKLMVWRGFPDAVMDIVFDFNNVDFNNFTFGGSRLEVIKNDIEDVKSYMMNFNNNTYIWDGINYLRFDGNNLINVLDEVYVPTTSISRSPSGGGEIYQGVNLLGSQRKNSFLSDGESVDYFLDATNINSVDKVLVNNQIVTNYSVNLTMGKITFTSAPSKPLIVGQDNVVITFSKNVDGYLKRIIDCTETAVFDNRIFYTGNPNFKNAVFHCAVNDPTYVSDLNYYECGNKNNPIKSIVGGNNVLWIFKEESNNKDTIFYMTPTTDSEYGRVYPTSQGNTSLGCYAGAYNYKDTIVFFSREGMEAITGNVEYEQSLMHKSSFVDSKLTKMSNYSQLSIAEYKGYLVVGVDDYIFLADYRQNYKNNANTRREYEWYLWKSPVKVKFMIGYMDNLYVGNENTIYQIKGTNDIGKAIESYWTTPKDNFGYVNYLKTINKRGAIAVFKNMQNGRVKIAEKTNKSNEYKFLKESAIKGFNFKELDFTNFSFGTTENSEVVFRIKEKKLIDISLKVYSDELDKPFSLIDLTLQAFIGGYVKRS